MTLINPMRGRLATAEAALEFALAGDARLTVVSRATGARFTYRVRRCDDPGRQLWFVSVLRGPDNGSDYQYLGTVRRNRSECWYSHGARARVGIGAPSARGFAWFWAALAARSPALAERAEVWHEGRCGRCGRALTVPESVSRGFGPECAGAVGAARQGELRYGGTGGG